MKFARGAKAKAICDRCGLTVPYRDLRDQPIDSKRSGLLVGRRCGCLDRDHEQYRLGEVEAADAIALRKPRPDTDPGRGAAPEVELPNLPSP
ncbi:hypothetical protein [Planktothrix phage Pra-JY27]|nr:hypothetical protein [Planktothrix phage Pag-Yong1]WEV89195.1 hypothetical protein [Synechococcus phage MinM2]